MVPVYICALANYISQDVKKDACLPVGPHSRPAFSILGRIPTAASALMSLFLLNSISMHGYLWQHLP